MTRVDQRLFEGTHYLGRPADQTDLIVRRRLAILERVTDFFGKDLDLVDVGCGNGASMLALSPKMRSCTGLEIYPPHVDSFEKMKTDQSNCQMMVWDIENHEFGRQFDRLICFEVVEHFRSEDAVANLAKLLKTGGLAAFSVPNKWWIFETHGARLPFLPWNRVPFFSWLPRAIHERFAHARIYTQSRIAKLLKNHGFEILEMNYITAPMDVLPDSALKRLLLKSVFKSHTTKIPFKAVSIFVLAKKLAS
jgi:2-polyprenyl-3-methyl-5-hydroxy-6-metoxy-1,4-benzoquinol methylase